MHRDRLQHPSHNSGVLAALSCFLQWTPLQAFFRNSNGKRKDPDLVIVNGFALGQAFKNNAPRLRIVAHRPQNQNLQRGGKEASKS